MKRTAAVVAILAGALLLFTGASASAGIGIGNGPCHHGNSNSACKEDPSSHGKDCDKHGNKGGENQDHCIQGSDNGGDDNGGDDNGGSDDNTGGSSTEGGTTVQGKIVHAPTVKGGQLAKTGAAQTTSALGIGLMLIGFGAMTRTFGKKEEAAQA